MPRKSKLEIKIEELEKATKAERNTLHERIRELEREKVSMIADHGTAKLRFEEMLRDQREEMNQYVLAGMLLMRETMRAKLRMNSTVEAIAMQHTYVGIKALMPYIDTGLLGLNVQSLTIFADRVAELLDKGKLVPPSMGDLVKALGGKDAIEKEMLDLMGENLEFPPWHDKSYREPVKKKETA